MEQIFGVSMSLIMVGLLVIFLPSILLIVGMAWRNQIMLKMGLRNIPRRKAQTFLIIVGIMISTLIMAAAFGTGDTISYSIRSNAVTALGTIDEVIVSARATATDSFGSGAYVPQRRAQEWLSQISAMPTVDGVAPGIGEWAPSLNVSNSRTVGSMRVAGVDPAFLRGFGSFYLTSGKEVRLEELAPDQVYINNKAAEELEAGAGDAIQLFVSGNKLALNVAGVVDQGGLAGEGPTLLMPLDQVQSLFEREGQINSIVVSNLGDALSGADLSEQVTRSLRVLFADREVARNLQILLSENAPMQALRQRFDELEGPAKLEFSSLLDQLGHRELDDGLISLLADKDVSDEILAALHRNGLNEAHRSGDTMFSDLAEFRVIDIKRQVIDQADEVGSSVTSIFVIMGLFSIMVGVLLIFLIFVMLAAARRAEMGMARAVGAKRRHLVQMYLFEGTAYALVSGAVGVFVGLAASALIVEIVNWIFSGGAGGAPEDFHLVRHFEVRSAIVAYCLGMVVTLATVGVSAYRVSRMNIVATIRGLPDAMEAPEESHITTRLLGLLLALGRPLLFAHRLRLSAARRQGDDALANGGLLFAWIVIFPVWIIDAAIALWRLLRPYLLQGWLTLLLAVPITWLGLANDHAAPFRIGISLAVIGIGLMARTGLKKSKLSQETADRWAFTFMGLLMLAFWIVPFDFLRAVAGDLDAGIEMFFISGIAMVSASVWTVMYNADLLLKTLSRLTARFGKLRPAVITAVAYPMSAKFRTGLTLGMFALVIFTLIVMSILTEAFSTARGDVEAVSGGWDIEGTVNPNTPIRDISRSIEEHPALQISDFEAIGGYTTFLPIEARQIGAEDQRWRRYAARAADDVFLDNTGAGLKLIAEGYGDSDAAVWQALRRNPQLVVVDPWVVPSRSELRDDLFPFRLEGVRYEDGDMTPIEIEVREPRTGHLVRLTVIGVLDRLYDSFGDLGFGLFVSRQVLDEALPFQVPTTTYRFKLSERADGKQVAAGLEAAFTEHGMATEVLEEMVKESAAANRAFNLLFTGYMGLGLMVGIAALGVVSLRAVVERRQQIGVLRAIGYRRGMVQLSFLLESSFVVLLGVAIGLGLGTIISFNIVQDIKDDVESVRFGIPWAQIGVIIAAAYLFSLATTLLPARQASRIYPAEALRYE